MEIKYPIIKPEIGDKELTEIRKVFESGWLTQGPYVEEFEKMLAKYVNARYAVAVTSCTTALYLCLRALETNKEVIVPDFTFPATANVVLEMGSKPVLVDVDKETFGIDSNQVEQISSERTDAVIVVHPFGHPLDLDPLSKISKEKGFNIIEDAATALGSIFKEKHAGNMGDLGCYSLHPRKIITTGEGGMIVTNDEDLYEKLLVLRNHGLNKDGTFVVHSLNFRLPDILAAIGIVQMQNLEKIIERRRKIAKSYNELLKDLIPTFRPLKECLDCRATYQSYIVKMPEHFGTYQESIIAYLKKKYSIETQIGTYALHLEPAFRGLLCSQSLKVSEMLKRTTLTLPLYNLLNYDDLEYIVHSLSKSVKRIIQS